MSCVPSPPDLERLNRKVGKVRKGLEASLPKPISQTSRSSRSFCESPKNHDSLTQPLGALGAGAQSLKMTARHTGRLGRSRHVAPVPSQDVGDIAPLEVVDDAL